MNRVNKPNLCAHDKLLPLMKLFTLASAALLTLLLNSCYTKFAGEGDYYGYTGNPPVHQTETTPAPKHSPEIAAKPAAPPAAIADTIVHGDTIIINDHPKVQASNS